MGGHVFVVQGDVTQLACDAWLLPTDASLAITEGWRTHAPDDAIEAVRVELPKEWGRTVRVARMESGDAETPAVWLTDTGGTARTDPDWYLEGVRQFLEVSSDGPTARGRAKRLLAMPVIAIGAGGQGLTKGEVLPRLLSCLREETERLDVDVALVARQPEVFAAIQAERRRTGDEIWQELSTEHRRTASEFGEQAAIGRLVLFLGAGVSVAAGLPSWDQLLRELAVEAGMNDSELDGLEDLGPLDASRVIEGRLAAVDSTRIRDSIAHRFVAIDRYALPHALLASSPVREVATMNYDTLFEQAADAAGRPVAILPYQAVRGAERWLLKMHGSVERREDIVLTREDYLQYADRRGALAGIIQALLITRHMLFVGFSLTDENFHRITDDVRRAVRGVDGEGDEVFGTALLLRAAPLMQELWRKELVCVPMCEEHADVGIASRQLEIFLDCLLTSAASVPSHLLDPTFEDMLDPPERKLAAALRELGDSSVEVQRLPSWKLVADLLESFGDRDVRPR